MNIQLLPFGLIVLIACEGEPHRVAAPAVRLPASQAIPRPGAEVSATCAAGAQWWQTATTSADSARVTWLDTVLVPPLGKQPVPACVVRTWLAHGRRGDRPEFGVSDDSVPPVLGHTGGEWRPLLRYVADGPDGNLSGYQHAQVRCTVAQSWDGRDDSDSTYVADEWYGQELTCWSVLGGVQAEDTTS
jgi:hypothetical protein